MTSATVTSPPGSTLDTIKRVARPLALAALALTAVLTLVGLVIMHGLEDSVVRWDLRVEQDLFESRTSLVDTLTGAGTMFSNTFVVAAATALVAAVTWWITRQWLATAFIIVAVGGEKLIYLVVTLMVQRPRPPVPPVGYVHATTSFPSGHTGAAVALYGGTAMLVAWHYRLGTAARVGLGIVVVAIAAIVAFCRTYRGLHYPSDVIAGAVLGLTWLVVVASVLRLTSRHDRGEVARTS